LFRFETGAFLLFAKHLQCFDR